jgi:ABC-2 type transport system permease protein
MSEQTISRANNSVPSSLSQVRLQTKYEFLNYFRSRRFFILLGITVAIGLVLTAIVDYYRPSSFLSSDLDFYSGWWGNTATFVVVLSGIFFGGDAISAEFQNKTGYYLVPNPIRRSSIYIGKWIAAFIASSVILGVFALMTIGNALYYFGATMPYQFPEALAFSWFYLIAVLGFAFFFSSLFKSSSYSILVTAILFLFAFSIIQTLYADLAQAEPWFILTYGASIIGNVLSTTYPAHEIVTHGIFGRGANNPNAPAFTTFNATIPEGLEIMLVYFIVTAVIGLILFERKEFN